MQNDRAKLNKKLRCKDARKGISIFDFCVLICHFVPDLIRDLPLIFEFRYRVGFRIFSISLQFRQVFT